MSLASRNGLSGIGRPGEDVLSSRRNRNRLRGRVLLEVVPTEQVPRGAPADDAIRPPESRRHHPRHASDSAAVAGGNQSTISIHSRHHLCHG